MPPKSLSQFGIALGLAGFILAANMAILTIIPTYAQTTDDWTKSKLYGAELYFPNFAVSNNGDLYVCLSGVGYGVYKLEQGDTEWHYLPTTNDGNCSSLAIDNTNNLYRIGDKPTRSLWLSTNEGASWSQLLEPVGRWNFQYVAVDPITPTNIHVIDKNNRTDQGTIHYTTDGGTTWHDAQFAPAGGASFTNTVATFIDQIAIDPTDSRYIYLAAGTEPGDDAQGIYRSSDGGQTYTRLVTFTEESRVAVAVSYTGTVFAAFDDTLWRSHDHGDSWLELPNARDFCGEGSASYIGFHPTLSQTLFLGYEADFACRSDNEGADWYPAYWDVPVIDPATPETWYVAHIPGAWQSTNSGVDWTEMNEGLAEIAIRRMAVHRTNPQNRYWVIAGNGVGFTQDGGHTWKFPLYVDGEPLLGIGSYIIDAGNVIIDPTNPDRIYILQGNQIFLFDSWEITPTQVITINPDAPELKAHDMVLLPTNPLTGYLAAWDGDGLGAGVYKTTDGGLTWDTANRLLADIPVRALLLIETGQNFTLFAGTIEGDGAPGQIYRSGDGGVSWVPVKEFDDRSVTVFEVDPRDPQHVLAGTAGNTAIYPTEFLFQSYDGGDTWTAADFGQYLPGCGDWTADIEFDPRAPNHLYFANANNGNMCHSVDGGQNWIAPYYVWAQKKGIGGAWVVHISHLPLQILPNSVSIQADSVPTQSVMHMGASSGVYSRILEDKLYYFPLIFKDSP